MNIIGNRKIFYTFSGLLILASIAALALWRLNLGIDFTGGSLIEVEFVSLHPDVELIRKNLADLNLGEVRIQSTSERGVLIRLKHIDEPVHQEILSRLGQTIPNTNSSMPSPILEKRFDTIGPTIGSQLRKNSLISIVLVILLIVSYLAWAFRKVSQPVRSWQYGLITVVVLFHDVLIPTGFFSIFGHFLHFEADTLFVTALLTILGFSVHDTIVVFDRIRENLKKGASRNFPAVVNASVNETMARSINTSATVILAILSIYFFSSGAVRLFALVLAVGVVFGTYSSIFIGSPLLVTWYFYQLNKTKK